MTRKEFIRLLDERLTELPDKMRLDILADYTQYFLSGMENGKSEEEIATSLGEPAEVAEQWLRNYRLAQVESKVADGGNPRTVLVTIALLFVNLTFVLGPVMGAAGLLLGLLGAALGLIVAPFGLLGRADLIIHLKDPAFAWFASLASVGLGVLLAIGLYYVSRWFYRLLVLYVQYNLRLIRGK